MATMSRDYRVAIVVTPDFAPRLAELAGDCHVWAVRTPEIEAAVTHDLGPVCRGLARIRRHRVRRHW